MLRWSKPHLLPSHSLNPIWTIGSGSLFILDVTPEVFFGSAQGLSFIIKDYDTMSKNDTLGKVFVTQEDLLNGDGERTEFKLIESASENPKQPVSGVQPCSCRWHLGNAHLLFTGTGKACLALSKGHTRGCHVHGASIICSEGKHFRSICRRNVCAAPRKQRQVSPPRTSKRYGCLACTCSLIFFSRC